jgi:phage terminase small subunit
MGDGSQQINPENDGLLRAGGQYNHKIKRFPLKVARFIKQYPRDRDGKQAAIRAGYSAKTAHVASSRLLSNVKIREAINRELDRYADRVEIKLTSVLRGMNDLARYDAGRMFNDDGTAKSVSELDERERAAIEGFECVNLYEGDGEQKHCFGQLRKFKMANKGANFERLRNHLAPLKINHRESNALLVEVLTEGQMTRVAVASVAGSGEEHDQDK